MFGNILDKVLHEDEDKLFEESKVVQEVKVHKPFPKKVMLIILAIFLLALSVRLYSLFYITQPENAGAEVWYSDVYHHWQIAYLSKTIGFKHEFLRLWDLKGMEYFWGLAHPLMGVLILTITGSTSIINFRIFSAIAGSLSIAFLFLIVRKHWNVQAALAAVLMATFNPIGIFNDASGMVEPLGILFMLAALYFYPEYAAISGVLLALGAMTRAEYWVLGGMILVGMIITKYKKKTMGPLLIGYLVPIVFYMKYLLDRTGNPIYPVWWNYMGNAVGRWQADISPLWYQLQVQKVYWVIAVLSFLGLVIALKKKPKSLPFLFFGFGNWLLWGVVIGMSKYLLSYTPRFWVDRIMLWPYMFLGTLITVCIFELIAKIKHARIRKPLYGIGWLVVVGVILASQILWKNIHFYYDVSDKYWRNFMTIADQYKKFDTGEGKVLVAEDWPPLIYMLVRYEGLTGKRIIGQMFDPFFYMESEPFNNWGENRIILEKWLKDENIRLVFFPSGKKRYEELVKREPEIFIFLDKSNEGIYFYKVDQTKLVLPQ